MVVLVKGADRAHSDRRGGGEDATVLLLEEDRPRGVADGVRATEVDIEDNLPLGVRHGEERLVAQDSRVADDHC